MRSLQQNTKSYVKHNKCIKTVTAKNKTGTL